MLNLSEGAWRIVPPPQFLSWKCMCPQLSVSESGGRSWRGFPRIIYLRPRVHVVTGVLHPSVHTGKDEDPDEDMDEPGRTDDRLRYEKMD